MVVVVGVVSFGKNSTTPLRAGPSSHSRLRGVPLGVHRSRPQRPDSDLPAHLVAVDVLLRREPDEDEEDEDEDEGSRKEDEDDDDNEGESDDGYSE